MVVKGSDGKHVGTVLGVENDRLRVASGGIDHEIDLAIVDAVDGDTPAEDGGGGCSGLALTRSAWRWAARTDANASTRSAQPQWRGRNRPAGPAKAGRVPTKAAGYGDRPALPFLDTNGILVGRAAALCTLRGRHYHATNLARLICIGEQFACGTRRGAQLFKLRKDRQPS